MGFCTSSEELIIVLILCIFSGEHETAPLIIYGAVVYGTAASGQQFSQNLIITMIHRHHKADMF